MTMSGPNDSNSSIPRSNSPQPNPDKPNSDQGRQQNETQTEDYGPPLHQSTPKTSTKYDPDLSLNIKSSRSSRLLGLQPTPSYIIDKEETAANSDKREEFLRTTRTRCVGKIPPEQGADILFYSYNNNNNKESEMAMDSLDRQRLRQHMQQLPQTSTNFLDNNTTIGNFEPNLNSTMMQPQQRLRPVPCQPVPSDCSQRYMLPTYSTPMQQAPWDRPQMQQAPWDRPQMQQAACCRQQMQQAACCRQQQQPTPRCPSPRIMTTCRDIPRQRSPDPMCQRRFNESDMHNETTFIKLPERLTPRSPQYPQRPQMNAQYQPQVSFREPLRQDVRFPAQRNQAPLSQSYDESVQLLGPAQHFPARKMERDHLPCSSSTCRNRQIDLQTSMNPMNRSQATSYPLVYCPSMNQSANLDQSSSHETSAPRYPPPIDLSQTMVTMAALENSISGASSGAPERSGRFIPIVLPDDLTPEERLAARTKAIFFETFIKDNYDPGVIQNTLENKENIIEYAHEIAFVGRVPAKPEPVDPMTLLEAIQVRIDYERSEMQKQCPPMRPDSSRSVSPSTSRMGKSHLTQEAIDKHFECRYQTEVNAAIASFLKAESAYLSSKEETRKDFVADVNALDTDFLGAPIKMSVYAAITKPEDKE